MSTSSAAIPMTWICVPDGHVVDAKSILGIFSLDLSKPISLEVYADDCDDLLKDLEQFAP